MGLLSNFKLPFGSNKRIQELEYQVDILTKSPGFAVTNFNTNNAWTSLIPEENNYFEQNILYNQKAIDYISNKIASAKIGVFGGKDKDRNELENIEIYEDLKNFNPYMNLWEARKLREMHLYITGAAYWYIDRNPKINKNVEYYPLDPTKMQIKTDNSGLPAYYQYLDADGEYIRFDPMDIIYFRRINPQNWFEGLSHIKNILFWSNSYIQGSQYNMNKLGNNINAEKFIVFDGISDVEREKVETSLRNKYGGVKNAGKTGILNKEPIVIDVAGNQKDLDYVEGMKLLREDILVSYGIPIALFFPSATNSNTHEARTLFQSDTLEPLLEQEKAAFNEQLIPKVERSKNATYYFDFEDIVEADKNALIEQVKKLVDSGIFTRNQALEYIGEDTIEGELGDEYLNGGGTSSFEDANPTDEGPDNIEEDVEKALTKIKSLSDEVDKMLEEKREKEFIQKNLKLSDAQEGIFYKDSKALFQDQFGRALAYLQETEEPTVRGIFNTKAEEQLTKEVFKDSYTKVISNSNAIGNKELKEELFKTKDLRLAEYKQKSISEDAITSIAKRLDLFSKEISKTTRDKLRTIIADGIENGLNKGQFVDQITLAFNGFIDGTDNVSILEKLDVYVDAVGVTSEGNVIIGSTNRYNLMLEKITQAQATGAITKQEMLEGLKALRGLIDPTDPLSDSLNNILTNVYQVPVNKGISKSRVLRIARTEATYARNLGFNDLYSDNPFVKGKRWKSLFDAQTRHAHRSATGQTVGINETFNIGGEDLEFPGDTSHGASAGNTINCRCRITAVIDD